MRRAFLRLDDLQGYRRVSHRSEFGRPQTPFSSIAVGRVWSRCGAAIDGPAAEARVLEGRGHVGLVEGAHVGAWRDDLVDPVEGFHR